MFQRLKGAIDSRIAEEQARQRQATQSSTTPRAPRRQQNGGTPTRRTPKQRGEAQDSTEKGPGPDPAEFESDFAIGEDESAVPSRVGTPLPDVWERGEVMKGREGESSEKNAVSETVEAVPQEKEKEGEGAGEGNNSQAETVNGTAAPAPAPAQTPIPTPTPVAVAAPSPKTADLPTEVRVKLRKLERLEGRYQELLKAYKTAHTRIQQIDPFEATLRENTPLTSIRDPGAFVEFLNQIALKGDMVLDELKRVSGDRDEYKKKFEESEKSVAGLRGEVVELKAKVDTGAGSEGREGDGRPSLEVKTDEATSKGEPEPASAKSPTPSTTSRLPSLALFSPKSKAKSPPPKETSEEFFSYDSEVPRLEAELEERQAEVESLRKQVDSVKGDLAVARESTESMVQTLETATRELHGLRDAKDKFEATKGEMQAKIDELQAKVDESSGVCVNLQKQIDELTAEKDRALQDLQAAEEKTAAAAKSEEESKDAVAKSQRAADMLNEKISQKDATVKDLEDTLAMYKSAERQEAKKAQDEESSSEKRIATMQNIMDSLKTQLKSAETTVADLNKEIAAKKEEFAKKPSTKVFGFLDDEADPKISGLDNRDAAVRYLADKFDLREATKVDAIPAAEPPIATAVPTAETVGAGKKKNKKKKKGKGAQGGGTDTPEHDVPVKVTEDLADADDEAPSTSATQAIETGQLQKEIVELREQIESQNATIDRLSARMKDQEAMREEIETLRDDLLHQGEEHVEARDALKQALIQKRALEESVERLEKELVDAQKKVTGGADTEKAHGELMAQFEELKIKSTTLQTDLAATEQLATARFKDITDLRDILSKAQPELRNLRNEVAELKILKDNLKNKTGELNRLEARHEDLKSEMKGLGKRLGDKDSEVKELNQKIEQETSGRSKAEDDLRVAQSDLRYSEARKEESIEAAAQTSKDLAKARDETLALKEKLRDLEDQLGVHLKQVSDLRDELSLKAALHTTSQSLVQSLRDQTHELSTQARESETRAESLEEELGEAQRMLSERTRESQTMRMLLSQAETGTEARLREMKERMEAAVEERDRVEDEAGVASRRMVREVEEARGRVRDASHRVKVLEEEKEEADVRLREMRRRVGEAEALSERSTKEMGEVRGAMERLREALDESERVVEELEGQRAGMRKELEEVRERAEKLARTNKVLGEEMKGLGQGMGMGMGMGGRKPSVRPGGSGVEPSSGVPSERSSFDSAAAAAGRVRSPTPRERVLSPAVSARSETPTSALGAAAVDYVYLKNVLLQFLEQRDKNHQKQLVPVLGMLLHFDRKDEQKWMAAISAR